jgi:hypothetical protein
MLPMLVFAQKKKSDFVGHVMNDLQRFVVEEFAKKDKGIMDSFAVAMLKPDVKTIYVVKTRYFTELPATFNGYTIVPVNADSAGKFLYKEQQSGRSVIIFMTDAMKFYQRNTVWIMPVTMEKSGRKYIPAFGSQAGVKTTFNFAESTAKFTLDSILYVHPKPSGI